MTTEIFVAALWNKKGHEHHVASEYTSLGSYAIFQVANRVAKVANSKHFSEFLSISDFESQPLRPIFKYLEFLVDVDLAKSSGVQMG